VIKRIIQINGKLPCELLIVKRGRTVQIVLIKGTNDYSKSGKASGLKVVQIWNLLELNELDIQKYMKGLLIS
jgi:hypothetical protein